MASLSIPEHDTFHKARQALLITTAILYLLVNVSITSETIEVIGLSIPFIKSDIIFYWRCVVIYFLIVTSIKVLTFAINELLEIRVLISDIKEKQDNIVHQLAQRYATKYNRNYGVVVKKMQATNKRKINTIIYTKKLYLFLFDIFLPLTLSTYVIFLSLE